MSTTTIYLCPLAATPTTIILRDPTAGCGLAIVLPIAPFAPRGVQLRPHQATASARPYQPPASKRPNS